MHSSTFRLAIRILSIFLAFLVVLVGTGTVILVRSHTPGGQTAKTVVVAPTSTIGSQITATPANTSAPIAHAPTSTPAPVPTATPAPTATSAPAPVPTPTTPPSWHTLATYSGNTAGVVGTISPAAQWRILYTCGEGPTVDGVWALLLDIPWMGSTAYTAAACGSPYPPSGKMVFSMANPMPAGTYQLAIPVGSPPQPVGPWTLTIQIWQ